MDVESAPAPDEATLYAEALQLKRVPERPQLSEAEESRDAELVTKGFEEYIRNRPGPESFPGVALQVFTMLGRSDATVEGLSTLVAREPGLTAMLLRCVNSALFRGVKTIVSVRDAIARLGLNEAGRVVGAAAAKVLFDAAGRASTLPFAADFEQLYLNAVTSGVLAGFVAVVKPPARADRCYVGGLLHDIGRSVALRAVASLRENGATELMPGSPQIYRLVDALHIPIGVDVLKAWELPQFVVEMANGHHTASRPAPDPKRTGSDLELNIVGFASAMQLLRGPVAMHPAALRDLVPAARALGFAPEMVQKLEKDRARFENLARALATD